MDNVQYEEHMYDKKHDEEYTKSEHSDYNSVEDSLYKVGIKPKSK